MEPFLTTRDLRATWSDFFSQKAASLQKHSSSQQPVRHFNVNRPPPFSSSSHQPNFSVPPPSAQPQAGQQLQPVVPSSRYQASPHLFLDDICFLWNIGRCLKAPGSCATKKGRILRHVCNYRPDPNNPAVSCGKDHPCYANHK